MNAFFLYSPLVLQTTIWPLVRPLFWLFLRLRVEGVARLSDVDRRRGVIFVSSHGSELDSMLIPASLPFLSPLMPIFYTSRERAFYAASGWRQMFYGGFLFKLWGAHRLMSGRQDYELSLSTHIAILARGKSLLMFPDGKRVEESAIGSIAHGGVGYLGWRTKAVIIPVRISGACRVSPFRALLRRYQITVTFGEPMRAETLIGGEERPHVDACKRAAKDIMERVRILDQNRGRL
jgi:1-acyl-sn-glycerol-3-phosphate acyltransferase